MNAGMNRMATFSLTLRTRVLRSDGSGEYSVGEEHETWLAEETAVIVCDMWDLHHDRDATARVAEMAPRVDEVLEEARTKGAFIIHAPSGCMQAYAAHPSRRRAQRAPRAPNLPAGIGDWCSKTPAEDQGSYTIDPRDSDPADDDPVTRDRWAAWLEAEGRDPRAPWTRQIDLLRIDERDAISDSGVEIWNMLEERGIRNVILLGVHVNTCVLGRPFGLRQMARNGKNVVLMRDLTDSLHPPARRLGSHIRQTELVIEHIERYVAPTITSDQLLGGTPFSFVGQR